MSNLVCDMCKMDNLAPDHWMSVLHMGNQIEAERKRLEELNGK
jgi:hypothetical protein